MIHANKWLLSSTILISNLVVLSGCANKVDTSVPSIVYVPQKCVIKAIQKPQLDHTRYADFSLVLKRIGKNSELKSEYADDLIAAQKVCE